MQTLRFMKPHLEYAPVNRTWSSFVVHKILQQKDTHSKEYFFGKVGLKVLWIGGQLVWFLHTCKIWVRIYLLPEVFLFEKMNKGSSKIDSKDAEDGQHEELFKGIILQSKLIFTS